MITLPADLTRKVNITRRNVQMIHIPSLLRWTYKAPSPGLFMPVAGLTGQY